MTAAPFPAQCTGRGRLDIALQPAVPSPIDAVEFYRTSPILYNAYWRDISPACHAPVVKVPMLFVGGWYDSLLPGTIAAFKHFASTSPKRTRIAIGPSTHFPWTRRVGEHDFKAGAVTDIDQLQVHWFDHWLTGKDTGLLSE
jgi:uncharacterized protein